MISRKLLPANDYYIHLCHARSRSESHAWSIQVPQAYPSWLSRWTSQPFPMTCNRHLMWLTSPACYDLTVDDRRLSVVPFLFMLDAWTHNLHQQKRQS
jgi:hypothetical protein